MWNSSIKAEYLASTIVQAIEAYSIRRTETVLVASINELRKQFPNCTDAEINDILSLCFEMYNMKHSDSIELVITAPETFRIKTKKTRDVVEKLIKNAEKSVVMTGYSISDYFTGMLDTIIAKSQQGVYVRFYVNDIEKSRASLVKMLAYRSKYLQFFEYEKNRDVYKRQVCVILNMRLLSVLIISVQRLNIKQLQNQKLRKLHQKIAKSFTRLL